MKSIKKITNKVTNNVSSLAGSALLVGATLTGGAAFAAAQSGSSGSSMDLGDYPQPFVTEDGQVQTSIVLGSDAAVTDVVGAVEIAGSLGMNAFGEQSVSVSGGDVSASWSAENGVTLDRQNSPLFLSDQTDTERSNLDGRDLNVLQQTSFQSADDEEVTLEHEVDLGSQDQNFNAKVGDFDDPVLHVTNPTTPENGTQNNLFSATVEFSDTVDFTEAGDGSSNFDSNADEWIEDGDTVSMFGKEFTFSDESTTDELVFYGTSNRVEVNTGSSTTVTVNGQEVQLEATYVEENGNSATVVVGGQTESVEEGDSVGPNGNIRVSDIYRTGPDGQGRVAFSQGSQELVINYGTKSGSLGDVELDGETVDGVQVSVDSSSGDFTETDGMTFYFGAQDSDQDYIAAGETYTDPLFGTLEFHYGGLSGDTAENPAAAFTVEANEDGTATLDMPTEQGDSASVTFADTNANNGDDLAFDSGEPIATYEGAPLTQDEYVVLNANEDAGLYQVTDITNEVDSIDNDGSGTGSEGDVSVTLENAVSGDTVTIEETDIAEGELDSTGNSTDDAAYTMTSESVEGMDFDVTFDEDGAVSFTRSGESTTQVFPSLYAGAGSSVVLAETTPGILSQNVSLGGSGDEYSPTLELPSTTSSSENTVTVDVNDVSGNSNNVSVSVGSRSGVQVNLTDSSDETVEFKAGEVVYDLTFAGDDDNELITHQVGIDSDQSVNSTDLSNSDGSLEVAAGVMQPQDDEDEEHAYFFEPDVSTNNAGTINEVYTGPGPNKGVTGTISENSWITADLDSQDNVEVGYNDYGAYTMEDTDADDSETFNLHLPSGQSTAGMAVTGTDGSISASGGGGGSAMAAQPTYQYAEGVLASDGNINQVKNNDNVILVGGPNANSLTQELVNANKTMPASQYQSGQGIIQLVDGFSEGNHALVVAGHSGEDTRNAAEFLANYRNNQDALEGQSEVTISTSSNSVVSN